MDELMEEVADEVYAERLRHLRRVAVEAPDDDLFDMTDIVITKPCGTARCLWGWAMVDPWFRENVAIKRDDLFEYPGPFGLSEPDGDALFGAKLHYGDPVTGAPAKALVIANIDRIIAGKPAIPYPHPPRD